MTKPDAGELATRAQQLRALHKPGDPLVLVNAWDAASARRVEDSGGRAIGTSSAAIAASLGLPDGPTMPLPLVFEAVARIVRAVTVPVTADLLDGYGLAAEELVDRLLDAGAVGCNLEDSDHAYSGRLLDRTAVAARITAVRRVAQRVGVDVVINARIDTSLHNRDADPAGTWADIVGRARRYLDAGADCVFPFGMTDPQVVAALVDELGAPVNASVALGGSVAAVAAAGASRVSIGPRAHHAALVALGELASQLLARTD